VSLIIYLEAQPPIGLHSQTRFLTNKLRIMSWILVILFLSLTYGGVSEANHDKKLPSASVIGTVYCDTCFQLDFSRGSHFISGPFCFFYWCPGSVSSHIMSYPLGVNWTWWLMSGYSLCRCLGRYRM